MWDVESGNVSFLRMRNDEWPCGVLGVSHRSHRATQMPCGEKHETRRSPTDQREVISPMRTDRSFHGFFTLAPRPTAWFLMRRRRDG